MALGFTGGGGDGSGNFTPIVKYDARAGRFFKVDRVQGAAGWETQQEEITSTFVAAMDFESIEVGWALFAAGQQPSFVMVPAGQPFPAKPNDQYKQGFRMMMKLGAACGGDVRELASTAAAVRTSIDTLHDIFMSERSKYPGQLPLVRLVKTEARVSSGRGQTSTNYAPIFEIERWVPRPADLPAAESKLAPAAAAPAPVHTPPPAQQRQQAVAGAEF